MLKKCHDHLHSVRESYFQHLCFASGTGVRLLAAGFAVIVHGLCPAVFEYTGSKTILKLHDKITARSKTIGHEYDI